MLTCSFCVICLGDADFGRSGIVGLRIATIVILIDHLGDAFPY